MRLSRDEVLEMSRSALVCVFIFIVYLKISRDSCLGREKKLFQHGKICQKKVGDKGNARKVVLILGNINMVITHHKRHFN